MAIHSVGRTSLGIVKETGSVLGSAQKMAKDLVRHSETNSVLDSALKMEKDLVPNSATNLVLRSVMGMGAHLVRYLVIPSVMNWTMESYSA